VTDKQVFKHLFRIAVNSKDPEGVVGACIVSSNKILVSSASADDGIRHAEDLVIEKFKSLNVPITSEMVLYTTLEPCSYRDAKNKVLDCTSIVIDSGLKNVVYAAPDPEFSKEAKNRFLKADFTYRMVDNKGITKTAIELFNSTIRIPLTSMNLPRKKKIPIY